MSVDLGPIEKRVWARDVGGAEVGDTLVLYLCYEHYRMGEQCGEAHKHWVLPAKEGCACIVCQHAALVEEVKRLQLVELALIGKIRAADAMAKVCDDWVERGIINSRSALADARLDYGEPYRYEAKANVEHGRLRADLAEAMARFRVERPMDFYGICVIPENDEALEILRAEFGDQRVATLAWGNGLVIAPVEARKP